MPGGSSAGPPPSAAEYRNVRAFTPEQRNIVINQFEHLDNDGDGRITRDEFIYPLKFLLGAESSEALFRAFDQNRDGFVTEEEFLEIMQLLILGSEKATPHLKLYV